MTKIIKTIAIGFLFFSAACVPSIHPLYTDQDVVFDAGLIGSWSDKDSTETWVFMEAGDKQYKVIHTDENGKSGEFIGHLVRIQGKAFLDLSPVRAASSHNDFYKSHFLKMHTFVLVSQTAPTAPLSILEPDWLKEHLERNPGAIRHEKVSGEIILTASTKELQAFLIRHIGTPGAFSKPDDCSFTKRGAK